MRNRCVALMVFLLILSFLPASLAARYKTSKREKKAFSGLKRTLVLDGSTVHNVGELQMHVGNWGVFGSYPGGGGSFSDAPSAQWPAGSGVEYLYVAGIWVGAIINGVPAVSTSAYQWEYLPTQDPRDIMYRATEGDIGGNRLPSPVADDDRDGKADEEFLDGWDDDEDGLVDEDFAAVSKQMLSCKFTDNHPTAIQRWPTHNPLNILVRQESYQWEEDRYDDFVGVEYKITNIGDNVLNDVFIGLFADCDAGPRDADNYWEDDATGRTERPLTICTPDLGPVAVDVAYTYDADGDGGKTMGYFAIMFLGHTTDPTGLLAPKRVEIRSYASFSGSQSYDEGGDPTNDFERYELLQKDLRTRPRPDPRDYRMLVSAGPFKVLMPESTLVFQVAFVVGYRLKGLLTNAASAQLTYEGAWFNLDADSTTGIDGKETKVYNDTKEIIYVNEDSCLDNLTRTPVPVGGTVYVNGDCDKERFFKMRCGYGDSRADQEKFRTGVFGKETQVHWLVGTAPSPPTMRIDTNAKNGIAIYWDNVSETTKDVKTQILDFEGYRVWIATGWDRPIGTSKSNPPAHDLWTLLFEVDIINSLGTNTGLDKYRYEPLTSTVSPDVKRTIVNSWKAYFTEHKTFPEGLPPGFTKAMRDTLEGLVKWELGMSGGKQYYRYVVSFADPKSGKSGIYAGLPYFLSVTAFDHGFDSQGNLTSGKAGDPSSNFLFVEPCCPPQQAWAYSPDKVYVVPNPATTKSMAPWTLNPNEDDPTGIKVEFRNLPASKGTIRIYTVAGDLVQELPFDGAKHPDASAPGCMKWDLVSRNGQDVTSGIYIYSVESEDKNFKRNIGKFVIIR